MENETKPLSDSPAHSVPSWIWLFTGVATGLFLAFLYYLAGIQTPDSMNGTTPSTSQHSTKPTQAPTFDFYSVLPDVSVDAPKRTNTDTRPNLPLSTPKGGESSGKNSPAVLLQTGAFSLPKDADRRRAELLLLGLNVNVEKVNVKGRTYHRVQVGPFDTDSALNQAKSLLKQNGIEHIQRQAPKS